MRRSSVRRHRLTGPRAAHRRSNSFVFHYPATRIMRPSNVELPNRDRSAREPANDLEVGFPSAENYVLEISREEPTRQRHDGEFQHIRRGPHSEIRTLPVTKEQFRLPASRYAPLSASAEPEKKSRTPRRVETFEKKSAKNARSMCNSSSIYSENRDAQHTMWIFIPVR